jgi:hypothetical protein
MPSRSFIRQTMLVMGIAIFTAPLELRSQVPAPSDSAVAAKKTVRQKPSSELSLFFPIDKTNVKILQQQFEYELVDKDKFRVGNVVFDARLFEFRVGKGQDEEKFKLKLKWPAGLLSEGEISIRDNIGKAIWIHPIDKETVVFKKRTVDGTSQTLAELEGDILPEEVFRGLQFVPYFQVCVQKPELPTRISLCSKDFFVQVSKGRLEIRSRDSLRQESFVNINGAKVDPQGVIFLTSTAAVISMRVLLLSGATLDIDTRMKEVEFRDIAANDSKGRLMLTGYGAEPAASHRVVKLADGSWRTEVALKRPVVFLRGEGDIPMRQEFVLQGEVRDQSIRVEVLERLPVSTYSSGITIDLKKNPRIQFTPGDEFSTIDEAEAYLSWNLNSLSDKNKNRRFLSVQQDGRKFTAAWDVVRYPRWDFTFGAALPLDVRLQLRGWMDNQNFGYGLEYQAFITDWKKDVGPSSRLRLPLYFSFKDHYNLRSNSYGLVIAPVQYGFKSGSAMGLSVGGFSQLMMPEEYDWLGTWNLSEVSVHHSARDGTPKVTSEIMLRSEFLYPHGGRRFYFWALEIDQLKLEAAGASLSLMRHEIQGGLKWQF